MCVLLPIIYQWPIQPKYNDQSANVYQTNINEAYPSVTNVYYLSGYLIVLFDILTDTIERKTMTNQSSVWRKSWNEEGMKKGVMA